MSNLFNESEITSKPLASKDLHSYRCRGCFGWIMIGATDDDDAMKEARRTSLNVDRSGLQKWDGKSYVPCPIDDINTANTTEPVVNQTPKQQSKQGLQK